MTNREGFVVVLALLFTAVVVANLYVAIVAGP